MGDRFDSRKTYTMVPNELIRSELLDPYEKTVAILLMSFNPSFPSVRFMHKKLGISIDKIMKCLKKLEELKIIYRYKHGRGVRYEIYHATVTPGRTDDQRLLRYTVRTVTPDRTVLLRQEVRNKNN